MKVLLSMIVAVYLFIMGGKDSDVVKNNLNNNSVFSQFVTELSTKSPVTQTTQTDITTPDTLSQINLPELMYLNKVLNILILNKWNGKSETPLPIKLSDVLKQDIENYIQINNKRTTSLTIPKDLETLFLTEQSQNEILNVVKQSRQEFIDYLKFKRVLPIYITTIDNTIFPYDPQKIFYGTANDPDAPPTAIQGDRDETGHVDDYSKLELNIYPVDIYNNYLYIKDSHVFGEYPQDVAEKNKYDIQVRDASIRFIMYHEMTHVLENTVEYVNMPVKYRSQKSGWIYATKSLKDVDLGYFKSWGDSDVENLMNNRHINQESQAEGISFELLSYHYNFNNDQRNLFWNQEYGRLQKAAAEYDTAMDIFKNSFPKYTVLNFAGKLLKDFVYKLPYSSKEYKIFSTLSNRLYDLNTYGGYLHPMRPEQTHLFWEFLQN
jgi:hypothetical protein